MVFLSEIRAVFMAKDGSFKTPLPLPTGHFNLLSVILFNKANIIWPFTIVISERFYPSRLNSCNLCFIKVKAFKLN